MTQPDRGITTRPSPFSVQETIDRLQKTLASRSVHLFALVDHSGEAEKVGLSMPPTQLLIFGNPAAGTPVMLAAPTAALDLPLKILVSQDPAGVVHLSWNTPAWLQQRHDLPDALLKVLAAPEALIAAALANP
ncbi:MAG TPA: DUF302 domain-containing protein [Acidobacteriaceae bacterium]|jgi:uncharacterized protein (DUF302 family)|nr:DUF302 domain-containing protein [Acidobacteriaceae bacterium]